MVNLAQALSIPDSSQSIETGTVRAIYADGSVDVDLGAGRKATACRILGWYTPTAGDVVELMRRNDSSWLCLGTTRGSNPTTVSIGRSWGFPYNITAAAPPPPNPAAPAPNQAANPLVVNATATRSWRPSDGWAGGYLPTPDTVGQGASGQNGYYEGCYFYGNQFAVLAGRSCSRLRIRLSRLGSGGQGAATQQVLATHAHASQPADQPYFVSQAFNAGALGWSQVGVFDIPTFWGNDLIAGTAKGIGHMLLASGYGNYSLNAGLGTDALSGQLLIDWV